MSDFFESLENDRPHFKLALQGFAGSGKTYTAGLIAKGLHERIGCEHPVTIFDTERASKYLKRMFDDAGIKVQRKTSRSLADLVQTFNLLPPDSIMLIDSISHVWENFLEAYSKKKKRTRLEFSDWGVIKPAWKAEFSERFVTSPIHIIMTGRAGYEYSTEVDEETRKRNIYKSGVKMKVEGETAYEPDILVTMERFESILGADKEVWREATILKDRSTLIDGKTFRDPTFADFLPALEYILSDPVQVERAPEADAASLIAVEEDKREDQQTRKILLERIESDLVEAYGAGVKGKAEKVAALKAVFSTGSWTEVSGMSAHMLAGGHERLKAHLNPPPDEQEPGWMSGEGAA